MKKFIAPVVAVVLLFGFLVLNNNAYDTSNQDTSQSYGSNAAQQEFLSSAVKREIKDATDSSNVSVEIGNFYFDPTILKIKKGTTVTWTNTASTRHDVKPSTSSPISFPASDLLSKDQSYSYTFTEVGEYYYFCSPHPTQMRAVIEVVE